MQRRRRNELHQLDVYRCALELYRRIGRMAAGFPRGEADLRSQMRRASRSVPFNIGEGVGKRGKARSAAYGIALGEAKELVVALDCVEIDELALGSLSQEDLLGEYGTVTPDGYWNPAGFIQDGLISHNFLRQYDSWTMDFSEMVYYFAE